MAGPGDTGGDETAALPALWPYLLACAAAALWVDFGSLHRVQHSDAILHVLNSLLCWTPFMWGQDRFGMLVPLLARPIRHPLANLLFQDFATVFSGLAAFFLLARYAIRDASYPLVGAIGAAGFLALTSPFYRFDYLVNAAYYSLGLDFALWALILLEPRQGGASWRRWVAALGLMALAHWVNCATALLLVPLVLCRGLALLKTSGTGSGGRGSLANPGLVAPRPGLAEPTPATRTRPGPISDRLRDLARRAWRTETVPALLTLGFGYGIGQQLIELTAYRPTTLAALPASEWPGSWRELARVSWDELGPPWPSALAAEAAVGLAGWIGMGRRGDRVAREAAALLATALALALLMGTRVWVKINVHAIRFLFPSALLAQTAVAALAVAAVRGSALRRWAPLAAAVALIAASALSYGWPSLAGVRRDIDRRCGALTDDLLASGCTHVAGNYWTVWVAVFHAKLVLHERGEARTVWGVAERAGPSFQLWKDTPMEGRLVGVKLGDGMGEHVTQAFRFPPLREVEVRPTIRVLRPIPRAEGERGP